MQKKQLKRKELLGFMAQLEPCRVAMEACGGAHHWAREFQRLGHEVKLIAPQYVKPYVKGKGILGHPPIIDLVKGIRVNFN